jgi:hypothetical protein
VDADFALRIQRLGTVRLRILGPDGSPFGERVTFSRVQERDGQTWWITLRGQRREDGRWDFRLEEGERRIGVHREGWRSEPDPVPALVAEGKVVEVECRMLRLGTILLTVLDGRGVPVTDCEVRCGAPGKEPRRVHARAMGEGVFRVRVDPGRTAVRVTRGEASAGPVEVDVKGGQAAAVTVRLEP